MYNLLHHHTIYNITCKIYYITMQSITFYVQSITLPIQSITIPIQSITLPYNILHYIQNLLHYMYNLLHYLYGLPVPVPVLVFLGQPPHIEVGLYHLRPQDIILLILPDRLGFCVAIKPKRLWS